VQLLLQRGACVTCKNDVRNNPFTPLALHTHTGTHGAGPVHAGAAMVEGRRCDAVPCGGAEGAGGAHTTVAHHHQQHQELVAGSAADGGCSEAQASARARAGGGIRAPTLLAHAAVRWVALTVLCVHGAQVLRRAAAAAAAAEATATAAAQVAQAAEDKAVAEAAVMQKLIDDKAALKAELEFLTAEVARFTAEEDERLRLEAEEVGVLWVLCVVSARLCSVAGPSYRGSRGGRRRKRRLRRRRRPRRRRRRRPRRSEPVVCNAVMLSFITRENIG
jgi:hypothetical protein